MEKEEHEALENKNNIDCNSPKWYNIDNFMVPAKLIYVFYGMKISCYEPYMILFLISIGLTPTDAGIIGGLRLIGFVVGGIFWGYIADQQKRYRLVIAITTIALVLVMFSQPFLSLYIGGEEHNRCPLVKNASVNQSFSFKNHTSSEDQVKLKGNYNTLFYTMLFVNIVAKFFEGPHNGFIDSGVIERCRVNPLKADYAFQRFYDPCGFAIGIIASNIFVDYFPTAKVTCYIAIFIIFTIVNIGFLINAFVLYNGLTFTSTSSESNAPKSVLQELNNSFDFHMIFFMLTVLVSGILQSFFLNFTLVLLKEMGAPTFVNGISMAVGGLSCMFSFYAGSFLIKKLQGIWNTILFCVATYFIRYTTMAYAQNPWLIPTIQVFQTFNFALFLVAAALYIKKRTKPEIQTVMFSIMNALFFGAGILFASLIGGKIYDKYNARTLFRIISYCSVVWSLVIAIYIFCKRYVFKTRIMSNTLKEKQGLM